MAVGVHALAKWILTKGEELGKIVLRRGLGELSLRVRLPSRLDGGQSLHGGQSGLEIILPGRKNEERLIESRLA
jgi:hypothetical protein